MKKFFSEFKEFINRGNVIDMGWTEDYGNRIQAIVYAWQGGMEGGCGAAETSGKSKASTRTTESSFEIRFKPVSSYSVFFKLSDSIAQIAASVN